MPRVPRVLPREGLLQPLRVPALGLDAGPEAFGAGIARGGLAAGQVMSDIALDQKRDADASAVTEIADAAMKASINLLSNPETGLLNRKMKAAEGMTVEAAEQFTQIWKDAAAAAKNPSQRKVIEKMGYVQSLQDTRAVMVKEAEQIEIYKNESAKQHLATNADRVALTPLDDEVAQRAVADVRASTRARMTGKVTPEELAELERGAESVIHSSRISSLIASGRNSDAVELYGKVEGSLTAQAREHFGPTIRAASDLVKTQDVVGAVYAKYPDDPEAAFAEVRSTLSGKPEEEAISSLKVRYDERDSIRRERQSADLDAGYQAFVQTGRISAIPRDVYARLEKEQPQAILAMRNQAEADANRRSSITRAEMDVDAVGELAMMHPDILALPENDPRIKLAGKAPPEVILRYVEQRAAAIDRQRGVTRTGAAIKGPSVLNQTVTQRIRSRADKLKMDRGDAGAFSEYVWGRVREHQDLNNGQNPDENALDKIIDNATVEGTVSGWWWDVPARRFEVTPEQKFTVGDAGDVLLPDTQASIPPDERIRIIKSLEAHNKVATEQAIREVYEAARAQGQRQ